MKIKYLHLAALALITLSFGGLVSADAQIETGYVQADSTSTFSEELGFRPDYIEFVTAQQIESEDFSEADPENRDCRHNVNGWSEGSALMDSDGVDEQYSIGMFRNSDSTNAHTTASSTNHVIRNIYTEQGSSNSGNYECGRLEASVSNVDDTGFELNVGEKYHYDEIIRYKAYQFPDNMEFDAGMTKISSEGSKSVEGLGFQPANLHFRSGQQIDSENSVNHYWRDPAGRSKGYTTLNEDGDVIDQQSIGTASSSDSTNAHRSIASDEYVINTVYVDQNGNLVDGSEPSRLEAKVDGANDDGFDLQVDNQWSGTDEMILWRAWGFSWYDFDIGYDIIGSESEENFDTGFEPDAIDIYSEQQITDINDEVLTPRNSRCDNAGGWSNGYYNAGSGEQWSLSTGRTSDSQDSHRYGASNSKGMVNLYNYDGNDCGNLDGEVTETNDDGFKMEFNSDNNFDSNYGEEIVYYRALDFIEAPPEIEDIDFVNSTEEHEFDVNATVAEGSEDVSSCDIEAEDGSGNEENYDGEVDQINDTYSECVYTGLQYDDNPSWETQHDDNNRLIDLDIAVEVEDSAGQIDEKTSSNTFPNNNPEVNLQDQDFEVYDDKHAFNVSTEIIFPDDSEHEFAGDDEDNEACQMILEGEDQTYDSGRGDGEDFNVDFEYEGGDEAMCEFSKVEPSSCESDNCEGDFDFDVLEDIDVTVKAFDHHGAEGEDSNMQEIPNSPPRVGIQAPSSGSLEMDPDVDLEIFVEDDENDPLDIEFRDSSDGEVIESYKDDQGFHDTTWKSLDIGDYEWEVEVSDPYGSSTDSSNFERVISGSYKVETDFQSEYNSLIVDQGSSRSLIVESQISSDDRENVKSYLSGDDIEPRFSETDDKTKTYNTNVTDPEQHNIIIEGENPGSTELEITTNDPSVGINTTETFPVYVRSGEEEGLETPGLTSIYLLFIVLAGSFLYFASL